MSDKNYNLENFEETKVYGRHFKEENDDNLSQKNDFDFEEKTIIMPDIKKAPPVRPVAPITKNLDYGDEYYNQDDEFVEQVINPYPMYKEQPQRRPVPQQNYKDEQIKRKNNTIVILTVALVLVIFISLLFLLITSLAKNSNNKNDNNTQTPTTAVTIPTVEKTELPTEEETEEPTEEETEAPTEEETEAPTDTPTDAPTEEDTETPTDVPAETPVE